MCNECHIELEERRGEASIRKRLEGKEKRFKCGSTIMIVHPGIDLKDTYKRLVEFIKHLD